MARLEGSYNPLLKSYPDSDKINAVSEGAEVLYVRLIAQSDDAGRYYGDPVFVLAKLFTSRMAAGQLNSKKVEERISELEAAGLVTRYESGGAKYLQLLNAFKTVRSDRTPKVRFPAPGCSSGTDECPTCSQVGTECPPRPDQTNTRPKPNPTAANAASVYPKAFEEFWELYPRKLGKDKALKAWESAGKRIKVERDVDARAAVEVMNEAAAEFAKSEMGRGDFCPYPATWLNGGRYNDDRSEWNRVREQPGKAAKPPEFRFGDDE